MGDIVSFNAEIVSFTRVINDVMRENDNVMGEMHDYMHENNDVMDDNDRNTHEIINIMGENNHVMHDIGICTREMHDVTHETDDVMREHDNVSHETNDFSIEIQGASKVLKMDLKGPVGGFCGVLNVVVRVTNPALDLINSARKLTHQYRLTF